MKHLYKSCSILGLALILFTGNITFGAVEKPYLVSQLTELAYSYDVNHTKLERTLDDLWKQRNSALEGKNLIQGNLDTLERFKTLYNAEKSSLTFLEKLELQNYQAVFGTKPPQYSGQEMLDLFIKNRDFSHASLLNEYLKLDNSKKLIEPTLRLNLYKLGVQIADADDTLKLQKSYEAIQTKKISELKQKYGKGMISKSEYTQSISEFEILKLQIKKLENTVQSARLNINRLTGLDQSVNIQLTNEFLISSNYKLDTLQNYISQGTKNRYEVLNAQSEYDTSRRELDIVKTYLTDGLLTDYILYQNKTLVAENTLKQVQENIQKEIISLYGEMIRADKSLKNQEKTYLKAKNSYESSKLVYKQGRMTASDFELATYQFNAAYNAYKSSNRKMGQLIESMAAATHLGPGIGGK